MAVKYNYSKCGRKATKMTPEVKKFILKRLMQLRTKMVVTSTTLQREVAREKGVKMEASAIRKHLKASGYKWLPRTQEPKYSKEDGYVLMFSRQKPPGSMRRRWQLSFCSTQRTAPLSPKVSL